MIELNNTIKLSIQKMTIKKVLLLSFVFLLALSSNALASPCYLDTVCDDGDLQTEDICLHPGAYTAGCLHRLCRRLDTCRWSLSRCLNYFEPAQFETTNNMLRISAR